MMRTVALLYCPSPYIHWTGNTRGAMRKAHFRDHHSSKQAAYIYFYMH